MHDRLRGVNVTLDDADFAIGAGPSKEWLEFEKRLSKRFEDFNKVLRNHLTDDWTRLDKKTCEKLIAIIKDPGIPENVKAVASGVHSKHRNKLIMEALEKISVYEFQQRRQSDNKTCRELIRIMKDKDLPAIVKEVAYVEAVYLNRKSKSVEKAFEKFSKNWNSTAGIERQLRDDRKQFERIAARRAARPLQGRQMRPALALR
jgi:uncharacterized protein (UPF0147 family)